MSALSGPNGRYAIDVVMGTGAGLARGPFRVEVRADFGGKRLGLVGGGSALVAEVVLLPGNPAQAEVRSNSELAVAAIATAFAQESITHAWVQTDFGAGANAGGSLELRYRDRVALPNVTPLRGVTPPLGGKSSHPAPIAAPVTRARDSIKAADSHARASIAAASKARRGEQRATRRLAERMRLDSIASVRASQRHADSLAWAARRSQPSPKSKVKPPPKPRVRREPAAKVVVSPAEPVRAAPSPPLVASGDPPARVRRVEPFDGTPTITAPADTCACRLRGTVEVAWPRPLEEGLPIELALEGPAMQRTEVTLDMGSPREFRLGPLPCGEYRLRVRPKGRLHYALQRGGDSVIVTCEGQTQVRVVLIPARK
ncbi:MAG: hypothetical protein ABIU54_06650 [Candidatus Eisenbacteria bacterium]